LRKLPVVSGEKLLKVLVRLGYEIIILNTPQLCCGDGHETDLRLKHAMSIDVKIAACKPLCL
jgi:hypothetical protein